MKFLLNIHIITIILCFLFVTAAGNAQEEREKHVEIIRVSGYPWLGVQISNVTPDIVDFETLPAEQGAYVSNVTEDSPADSGGLRQGDIIIRFADREIYEADGLVRAVRRSEKNEPINIVIIRNGEEHTLTVTLRERPRRQALRVPGPDRPRIMIDHRHGRLGISVIDLNPQLGEYFKVPDGNGVLVEKVREDTPAEKAGIRAGDVIVKIGDREIDTARRLRRVLSTYDAGEEIQIELVREGARRTVTAQLEERSVSEFYFPEFDPEDFEIQIFGPGGAEEFRRKLEESIRPGLEDLKIQLKEHFKDFQIELPEQIREVSRQIRI